MDEKQRKTPWSLIVLVVMLSSLTALFFGLWAGMVYSADFGARTNTPETFVFLTGQWWGACTGLLAGILWCWLVIPARMAGRSASALSGTFAGVLAGLLSTALLHAGLYVVSGQLEQLVLGVGLLCGLVAGAVLGAICGAIVRNAVECEPDVKTKTGA